MKRKKSPLINYYNINPETKAHMIEVSLDNYAELFNGWDASPLRRRDLEPELLDYIERCGEEIPIDNIVELYFYLSEELKDDEKENRSMTGIKNNFNIVMFFINKELRKIYRQIFTNIVMSIIFLVAAFIFKNIIQLDDIFSSILVEGLYIGGWFLLWEAFSMFFFTSHEVRLRRKVYLRFMDMKIYFNYLSK